MGEKRLHFINISCAGPVLAECTGCDQKFKEEWTEEEGGTGEAIKRVEKRYANHVCPEDFSQAAARIVREATKN